MPPSPSDLLLPDDCKNLAVGDKVDFRLKTGEDVTVVVTQSTDEYVRFESVDCVGGKEVPWSDAGNTKCGIAASDVMKYLNEEIWSQLPEDLQAAITPVKRKHKDHEGNVQEYEFKTTVTSSPVFRRKSTLSPTARLTPAIIRFDSVSHGITDS